MDRLQEGNANVAFYVALPAGDLVHAFERALAMVGSLQVQPGLLKNLTVWVGKRKTTPTEARLALDLLLPMVQKGNADASDAAIDFVAYQLHGTVVEQKDDRLVEMFGPALNDLWLLLQAVVASPGQEAFWLGQVAKC